MAIFSALNIGNSALQTYLNAIQTTGHNIANATTPGFSRQRVKITNQKPVDLGFAQMGMGVKFAGVERIIDLALLSELNNATSLLGEYVARKENAEKIETFLNDLDQSKLSGLLQSFFEAFSKLALKPEDTTTRNEIISSAKSLTDMIRKYATDMANLRKSIDNELLTIVGKINTLTSNIADLNKEIINSEKGGYYKGTANDLRDRRDLLIKELSELVKVEVVEKQTGAVDITVNGNTLVSGNNAYELTTDTFEDNGDILSKILFKSTGAELQAKSGKLKGLLGIRDEMIPDIQRRLDLLARGIISGVNDLHSQGVGLSAFSSITSENSVIEKSINLAPIARSGKVESIASNTIIDPSLQGLPNDLFNGLQIIFTSGKLEGQRINILDFDGTTGSLVLEKDVANDVSVNDSFQISSLNYPIKNGSFNINVVNLVSNLEQTFNFKVDIDKIAPDVTLQSLADDINNTFKSKGIPVTAKVTLDNRLKIESSDNSIRFYFSDDTSNFLSAMGINVLFTGKDARSIGISKFIERHPEFLSASHSFFEQDNLIANSIADLRNQALFSDGSTIEDFYISILSSIGVETNRINMMYESQKALTTQLENQRDKISGVNLDEEASNLIVYQRAYQASAKFISTINDVLDILMSIVR